MSATARQGPTYQPWLDLGAGNHPVGMILAASIDLIPLMGFAIWLLSFSPKHFLKAAGFRVNTIGFSIGCDSVAFMQDSHLIAARQVNAHMQR